MSTAVSLFVKRLMQKKRVENIISYPMVFRKPQAKAGTFGATFYFQKTAALM
jgi:hypothetical protein